MAGIGKGTVYLYFKNKEELYVSLMSSSIKHLSRFLKDFEDSFSRNKYKTSDQIIKQIFQAFLSTYRLDTDGMRIIQSYQQGEHFRLLSSAIRRKLDAPAKENFTTIRKILSEAMESGKMKKVDVFKLGDVLWGMFIGIVQLEESKLRTTRKDHIIDTLTFGFSLIANALSEKASKDP